TLLALDRSERKVARDRRALRAADHAELAALRDRRVVGTLGHGLYAIIAVVIAHVAVVAHVGVITGVAVVAAIAVVARRAMVVVIAAAGRERAAREGQHDRREKSLTHTQSPWSRVGPLRHKEPTRPYLLAQARRTRCRSGELAAKAARLSAVRGRCLRSRTVR